MTSSRILAISILICVVTFAGAACSGGSNSPSQPTTPPPPPPASQSVADVLQSLDRSGAAPTLDRSTSVTGPDADRDGVRDDIETYIDSLPDTPSQKLSLRQTSYALSKAFAASQEPSNASAARDAATEIDKAVVCAWAKYGATANTKIEQLSSYMSNTKERFIAYDKFNRLVSGTSSRLPEGDTCEIR